MTERVLTVYFFCFYQYLSILFFFFFSSRRRHTRSDRDWSSDVCSSDLELIDKGFEKSPRTLIGDGPVRIERAGLERDVGFPAHDEDPPESPESAADADRKSVV